MPQENKRLFRPNMVPTKSERRKSLRVKSVKGFLLVRLRRYGRYIGMINKGKPAD